MIYYKCLDCTFTEELHNKPTRCQRCRRMPSTLQFLTKAAFLKLYDAGEVRFCEACQKVHTR